MTADVLRRAAGLMRERATHADALRFWPADDHDGMEETYTWPEMLEDLGGDDALNAFVASWHPAVALAVADWLDGISIEIDGAFDRERYADVNPNARHALTIARTYLGESS